MLHVLISGSLISVACLCKPIAKKSKLCYIYKTILDVVRRTALCKEKTYDYILAAGRW